MTDQRYPIGKFESRSKLNADERLSMIEQIAAAPALMREAVRGLSESQLNTPYREGGWTVRQVVHHVPDSHLNGYTLGTFASRPGIQLLEAENGLDGIDAARRERPDLIMLDLMMPGIGGHEVLERLKDDSQTAPIPVVMITSRFINEDERHQILGRAVRVIYKGDLSRELVTGVIDDAVGR